MDDEIDINNPSTGNDSVDKKTPQEKSRLLDSLSNLGGKVVEGAGSVARSAGRGLASGARAVASGVGESVTNFREKRAVTAGLKQDFSVKGKTKRYWLDTDHYIVFDPDNQPERDMAQQAIDDYRLYGKFEGEAGDRNEVIEAGEAELKSKKLTRDPMIDPETARRMEKGGRFLANAKLMGPQKRKAGHYRGVDLDEDEVLSGDDEGVEFDMGEEDEEPQPRSRGKFRPPTVEQAMGIDIPGGRKKFRTPEDQKVGKFKVPEIRVFSDGEMFPSMVRRRARQPDYDDDEEPRPRRSPRPVEYRPPDVEAFFPKIFPNKPQGKRQGPVEFTIPSIRDVVPKIHSPVQPQPRSRGPSGPLVIRPPKIENILPKIESGFPGDRRVTGPIVYNPPSIESLLPRIGGGFKQQPRRTQPLPEPIEAPKKPKKSKTKKAAPTGTKSKKTSAKKKRK